MAKNIDQVFVANPITSNLGTDLMYFGQSPYGAGNDAAMTYANFKAQFTLNVLTTKGDILAYDTAPDRLAVGGTNGQVLQVNSAAAIGLSWSTAAYPTTTTINNILFSSAANTVSQIAAANSGVLVSSGTGVPSMLAAGTTGQVLQASTAGTPSWSTPTYPSASGGAGVILRSNGTNNIYSTSTFSDTYTASNILYSNGANTVTGLATANGGVLVTSNTGVPSILAGSGTTNTILQATASGTPAWSTATYPATTTINQILFSSAANVVGGISTANNSILQTNGSGVPSFATSLPSGTVFIATVDQTSASVTLAVNTQYITDNGASLVTYTLPTTCAIGSIFKIRGFSTGGWKVAQSSGQQIHVGSSASTLGATGSIASSNTFDCVDITCVAANNTFVCSAVQGALTIV